jgi:hypothetical protein
VRDSVCVLSAQQAFLHFRKPRPPTVTSSNRCHLKTQHISQQRSKPCDYRAVQNCDGGSPVQGFSPDQVDATTFENMNTTNHDRRSSLVSTPTETIGDPGSGFALSQVVSELSCSKELLCQMEALRHYAKKKDCRPPSPERRRSPLRRLLAKPEPYPAQSLAESLPVEGLASPIIRYLPGCGLSAIRRTHVVRVIRLRDMCNESRGSEICRFPPARRCSPPLTPPPSPAGRADAPDSDTAHDSEAAAAADDPPPPPDAAGDADADPASKRL